MDPERGRFRSFLPGALKHYLANERDRSRSLRRGGGMVHLSLEHGEAEAQFQAAAAAAAFDKLRTHRAAGRSAFPAENRAAGRRQLFTRRINSLDCGLCRNPLHPPGGLSTAPD